MADLMEKLSILGESARYDASCASSGSSRKAIPGGIGNAAMGGICHTWAADGRCVSLLKVLQTNRCIFNCEYCHNRRSADVPRSTFAPKELAELTIQFYRRNYIEGLFLSSGILKNPDYTMELMLKTVSLLRNEYRFGGYIHMKIIPGADPALVDEAGRLADRVSCNIELPTSDSLRFLAPDKQPAHIFEPMRYITRAQTALLEDGKHSRFTPSFAPAGQSTQMIIGATPESDRTIIKLSHGLYRKYRLKRVYYSAYIPLGTHPGLPAKEGYKPPLLREHRLYQADWLMRFYHFDPEEIVEEGQNLDRELDPKCAWALRHPEYFPVESNTAPYERLLRVPGVGVISARRILETRRTTRLRPEDLRKLGIVMKRAKYFLTAGGHFVGESRPDHPFLREALRDPLRSAQLSFFGGDPQQITLPARGDVTPVLGQI